MLLSKLMKNGLLRVVNDLDCAGRGGRKDEKSEKMKNEKVAKGHIIGLAALAGPCSLFDEFQNLAGRSR